MSFLPRDAMQARPMSSCGVRLSVRPSVTFVNYAKACNLVVNCFHSRVAKPFYTASQKTCDYIFDNKLN